MKISEFSTDLALTGAELVPIVIPGNPETNGKATIAKIIALVPASSPAASFGSSTPAAPAAASNVVSVDPSTISYSGTLATIVSGVTLKHGRLRFSVVARTNFATGLTIYVRNPATGGQHSLDFTG